MKFTKEHLRDMNTTEINTTLARLLDFNLQWHSMKDIGRILVVEESDGNLSRIPDYCNNPSDIIPLAFEYRVSIEWFSDGRCLVSTNTEVYQSTNPLRAIACCLILVLQEDL